MLLILYLRAVYQGFPIISLTPGISAVMVNESKVRFLNFADALAPA